MESEKVASPSYIHFEPTCHSSELVGWEGGPNTMLAPQTEALFDNLESPTPKEGLHKDQIKRKPEKLEGLPLA